MLGARQPLWDEVICTRYCFRGVSRPPKMMTSWLWEAGSAAATCPDRASSGLSLLLTATS